MEKNYKPVKAKVVCHENGKPVVYLSMHRADLRNLCLEKGKQPKSLFTIVIKAYGVEY